MGQKLTKRNNENLTKTGAHDKADFAQPAMGNAHWVSDLFWLLLVLGFIFSFFLGTRPLNVPDEGRYCEIAREMLALHDFITPHINGIKYFEKPPLFYWMQAGALHLFGLNEWSCRFSNALMGLLGCLIVYLAGRKLFDRKTGIYSALILSSSLLYFILARMVTLDMTLSVMLISCLLCFLVGFYESTPHQKYYFYAMYFFSALAVLTKGLVGIIFPGSIIFLWLCFTGNWPILKKVRLISGGVLFLVVVLPWHILVQLKNPEFFRFYFVDQQFYRYFTMYAHRYEPNWYYLMVISLGLFPWAGYLIGAGYSFFDKSILNNRDLKNKKLYLWMSAIFILIFYSFSKSKLIPYVLPCFPLFAILIGAYFADIKRSDKSLLLWIQLFVMIMIATGFVVTILLSVTPDIAIHYEMVKMVARIVIGIFFVNCVLIPWLFWKKDFITAMLIQFLLSIVLLFVISIAAPHIYMDSIKPIAVKIKALAKPNDEVVAYNFYYQDLPFYLDREVTLVDWRGELEFGREHSQTSNHLMSHDVFWSSTYQKKLNQSDVFFVMPKYELVKLQQQHLEKKFLILLQTKKDILVKINPSVLEHSKGESR